LRLSLLLATLRGLDRGEGETLSGIGSLKQ